MVQIARDDELVAYPEVDVAVVGAYAYGRIGEATVTEELPTHRVVERRCLRTGSGQDQHLPRVVEVGPGGEVVLDQLLADRLDGVGGVESAVVGVRIKGGLGLPDVDVLEGGRLPGFDLAVVPAQDDRVPLVAERDYFRNGDLG